MTRRLLVLIAAGSLVGCGAAKPAGTGRATPRPAAKPTAASGVVWVRAGYDHGRTQTATGFVYDTDNGWVITANHAVEAAKTITVTQRNGRVVHGRLLARAQCHDFAVVQLSPVPDGLHALALGDSSALRQGQRVTSIAYAAPGADTSRLPTQDVTYGQVTGSGMRAVLNTLLPSMGPLVAHTAPLNDFASGSPLLDARHEVVGLNTMVGYRHGMGTKPGMQYAMSSNELKRMLDELKPGPQHMPGGWRAEHRCHRAMDALAGVPYTREKMPEMNMNDDSGASGGDMKKKDKMKGRGKSMKGRGKSMKGMKDK